MLKSILRPLVLFLIITRHRFTNPPRVLTYGREINADILRAFGAHVGKNVMVNPPFIIHEGVHGFQHLSMGDNVFVNGNVFVDLNGKITLEDGVSIGPGVTIMTHNSYNYNEFLTEALSHTCGVEDVLIRKGANVKAHALITRGITIGHEAVVAGGAVVNKDVPDRTLVAGNPAKVITEIF